MVPAAIGLQPSLEKGADHETLNILHLVRSYGGPGLNDLRNNGSSAAATSEVTADLSAATTTATAATTDSY